MKYKKVMKKSGGRPSGGKNFKKRPQNKQSKFRPPRKVYSLANAGKNSGKKRKTDDRGSYGSRAKREKEEPQHDEEEEELEQAASEEEEEDSPDNLQQLLGTFKNLKSSAFDAIDSESDTEEESDDLSSEEEEIDAEDDNNDEKQEESTQNKDISNPEEEEEIEIQLVNEEDESINDSIDDPFVRHCLYDINDSLLNSVQSTPPIVDVHQEIWPELGKLYIQIPKCDKLPESDNVQISTLIEKKIYAPGGMCPSRIFALKNNLEDLHIKPQIAKNAQKANKVLPPDSGAKLPFNTLQAELFSIANNYQDLYYPHRSFDNAESIRFVYSLHTMNHIMKTRLKVIHHNARLTNKDDVPDDFRDQGLTRPKVLIIVPFRDAAYKVITFLIDILIEQNKGNVMNRNRFEEEFTGGELIMPKKNPKPEDYELLFSGNSNDDFKIGITVTKKSLKLYADFYSSDIIIASPLGLRPIIGAEGEPERDYDFLASIELLILDQAEIFLMQNWDHLLHIFKHLHLQPKDSHGTDFSRVRHWSLNGWAKYYRQTLIFSSVQLPEINSIFNKQCWNYAGKVRVSNPVRMGVIRQVYVQMPHVYHKFNVATSADALEARFQFFINKILPQQRDTLMKQTMIYVPNYFDYVRLRNYFKKEDIGFVQICEYSKDAKIARARDMFFHGDAHFMLYTERYHFFNRKSIKGIRHLIFYQLPSFPHFYYEMCNLMQEANMNKKIGNTSNMSVSILYCKYDVQQLAAAVGTERAAKMVQSDRSVHMLITD